MCVNGARDCDTLNTESPVKEYITQREGWIEAITWGFWGKSGKQTHNFRIRIVGSILLFHIMLLMAEFNMVHLKASV